MNTYMHYILYNINFTRNIKFMGWSLYLTCMEVKYNLITYLLL